MRNGYFPDLDPRARGGKFVAEAQRLLHLQMMEPSVDTVQTSLLIGHYLGGEGNVKAKHIYLGIARLHGQAIRIWEMPEGSEVVLREIRRRTWLSVIISDSWSATDMATQPILSKKEDMIIPLVDDVEFFTLQPEHFSQDLGVKIPTINMWAQMAATIDIYRRVSRLISSYSLKLRSIASSRHEVSDLSQQLDRWIDRLPPQLHYSTGNLAQLSKCGLGRTFLSMHMGYHHFRQLLYYPFLNPQETQTTGPQPEGINIDAFYSRECKGHATAVSDMIKVGFQTSSNSLAYFLTGHILVVSSSIHLHTLLLGDNPNDADMARERLISNFEILMVLKMYWPVVDYSVRFPHLC